MTNGLKWINRQVRLGWILLAGGVVVGVTGALIPVLLGDLPFNERIITGVGILLIGIGVAQLVRYTAVRRDKQAAQRLVREERDERMQTIRARAGSRAYWVSAALAYALLMWVSFSQNGSLPALGGDLLWFLLAGVVGVPFGVYIASIAYDQNHM